jgi:hypothetical protein
MKTEAILDIQNFIMVKQQDNQRCQIDILEYLYVAQADVEIVSA